MGILEWLRPEELTHVLVHLMERKRIRRTRAHLVVGGLRVNVRFFSQLARRRAVPLGDQGHDRVDHEINRDHVEHGIRQTGELGQRALGVGHDERVGHLVAVDPAGERVAQCGLNDGRAHDGQPVSRAGPLLLRHSFAQSLGKRVDVGPPQGLRTGSAVVDQPFLNPCLPSFLRGAGYGLGAFLAELRGGLLNESLQPFG